MAIDPSLIVAGGAAGAWLWDKYGKELLDKLLVSTSGTARDRWHKFGWQKAAQKYRESVKRLYNVMRILGMPEPVPLENIFTDVYILDRPMALRRYEMAELERAFGERDVLGEMHLNGVERVSGLDLVIQQKRLFILGKPGAGKTTFLKYLSVYAAEGQLDRVPVYISLKDWSDSGLDLKAFLEAQFVICQFPDAQAFIENLLNSGDALVLFDGLDEVNAADNVRDKITRAIRDFSNQYSACTCVITCRIAAVDFQFEHFRYVEMADFTRPQVEIFVGKWFRATPNKGEAFFREFDRPEHDGLRELARTPLLLTLLCLGFDSTLTFPNRRVEIYDEAVEALLKKWDATRAIKRDEMYRTLTLGRKRQLLARIAAMAFETGAYFMPQDDLQKQIEAYMRTLPVAEQIGVIDGEAVLKAIEAQHGLLVERAHRVYSFSHLALQEYFTAKYIVESASDARLRVLMHHADDHRWHEVFPMTASLLDDADIFFDMFRNVIDDYTQNDDALRSILAWATRKARSTLDERPSVRALYMVTNLYVRFNLASALALARGHARTRIRDLSLAHTLTLSHAPDVDGDLDLDLPIDRDVSLARELDLNLDLTLTRDLAFALASARSLVRALNPDLTGNGNMRLHSSSMRVIQMDFKISILLYTAEVMEKVRGDTFVQLSETRQAYRNLWDEMIRLSMELDQHEFVTAVCNLLPPEAGDQSSWRSFADKYRSIALHYRDIRLDADLTRDQITHLLEYLRMNGLLLDCLKLAVVSDRDEIRNSLLLPPAVGDKA